MTTSNTYNAIKTQLLAQLAESKSQLATLRGGDVSRAEASAEHFNHAEDSDVQIPMARLQATPSAARCITCQEKLE